MNSVLYNDDCINVFKTLPKRSVDLVVVDLPYETTTLKWDKCIDLDLMWKYLRKILKHNGQALFFTTTKLGAKLINANTSWFCYDLVWEKNKATGHLFSNRAVLRKHEMIYLFHNKGKPKGEKLTFNPQMTAGEPYSNGLIPNNNTQVYTTKNEVIHENLSGDRYPHSIVKIGNSANNRNKLHPTQKPVELCEWLIKTYSNEGDVVMDFTMGSGSTIIACINTNRKYIGIEMDKDIFITAEKRIKDRLEK
jgi:site-specific DNA-methyltransferase (adenine-specific)